MTSTHQPWDSAVSRLWSDYAPTLVVGMLLLVVGCAGISQSGTSSSGSANNPGPNAIPSSFFGFIVNRQCSISDTAADGSSCNNPESHSFPGLPLGWSRSLGPGQMKWS